MKSQRPSHLPRIFCPRNATRKVPKGMTILFASLIVTFATSAPAMADTTTSSPTSSTSTTSTTSTTQVDLSPSSSPPVAPHPGVIPLDDSQILKGEGSSFAAPAVDQWKDNVQHEPYGLTGIDYTSDSSGNGRESFTNRTVDFAVSDTDYVSSSAGNVAPTYPFRFVPVTAGGIAFMYNIPGLTSTLQLTSYTMCLALTGQVTNWDDPVFHQNGANSGVTLPNVPIIPVTESDPAGTNYVLEEYCINEQPAVWAKWAATINPTGPTYPVSPTQAWSNWDAPPNGINAASTTAVAADVAQQNGAVGAVQVNYANSTPGFNGTNPAKNVAQMQNASGDFTTPTAADVASALAYASQKADGTHVLNFNGTGPHVYNPSTYSYLLTPTTGWTSAKGAVLSQFVNYVLTLGQGVAPSIGYASLGLSLERSGIDAVIQDVPGAVDPTTAEDQAYACGDLTPTEVQAGQTTPTCGVTNGAAPPAPPGAPPIATTNGAVGGASAKTAKTSGLSGSSSTAGSSGGGGGGAGVDPAVSLGGSSGLAFTGSDPFPVLAVGVALLFAGWFVRRRLIRGDPSGRNR